MVKKGKKQGHTKHEGKPSKVPKSPAKAPKNTSEPALPEIISETIVEYLHEVEGESPIDLSWENFIKIRAVPIEYENYEEVPLTLGIKNTAYNIVLTGTWPEGKRPYVSKGPLASKYEFAQAHFHWGPDSKSGSDHEVEGLGLPFEVHLVFYKSTALSIEEAKKEEDGIVMFCYLYRIQDGENETIKPITDNIKEVTYAYSKKDLQPIPLINLFEPITEDYIVYLGFMKYKAVHGVTYIISRKTQYISEPQLNVFRDLKDRHENPMILKKREVQNYDSRNVFVVNPHSTMLTTVLHTTMARISKTSTGHSPKVSSTKSLAKKRSSSNKNRSASMGDTKRKQSRKSRASRKSKASRKSRGSGKSRSSGKSKASRNTRKSGVSKGRKSAHKKRISRKKK